MHTVTTLTSGLVVANFSSPHPFNFEDGAELSACSAERANRLMLHQVEREIPHPKGWVDIDLTFELSEAVSDALAALEADESIDIVLVPFPVLDAVKRAGISYPKMRVIRVVDRVTKAISISRFCV